MAVAVTVAALVAPGAAAAAPVGATGGHWWSARNHAPAAPEGVRTTAPDALCAADGSAVPVRSTTPTLRATLSDPDGDQVRGVFTVRRGLFARPWSPAPTPAQASGAEHAVTVPAGILRDGGTYEWRVQAVDPRGRTSPTVRCRITVDTTAPGVPEVGAVAGSAPAVYLEDQTSGAVGEAGEFRFGAGASTDVVAFQYEVNGTRHSVAVPTGATEVTVTWVPAEAGTHALTVRAVDAAGNVSADRLYRFTVGAPAPVPTGDARWTLDEGAGSTAADTDVAGGGHTLTLTGSTTWGDGLRAELVGATTDRAMLFDEPTDGAATAGPVVDTTASYSVVALVRAGAEGSAVAVSQDGATGSAFTLGARTDTCAEGVTSCWALSVTGADGAQPVVATSTVPVVPGAWVALFGVHTAPSGELRLDVCSFGTAEAPETAVPVAGAPVAVGGLAPSTGPLRVGSAQSQADAWVGAVSGVRTYAKAVGAADERILCSRGA